MENRPAFYLLLMSQIFSPQYFFTQYYFHFPHLNVLKMSFNFL